MVHEISRPEILSNLVRFKESLSLIKDEKQKIGERAYKVLINRRTGEMRFAQKIHAIEHHIGRKGKGSKQDLAEDWRGFELSVRQNEGEPIHFESKGIQATDLEPLAWRITNETLDILNALARDVKTQGTGLPEETLLSDLTLVQVATQKEKVEDFPGWAGGVDRIAAENKLTDQPVGTYLLREGDEITVSTVFHISEENLTPIHTYVLTFVSEEINKIAEILLIETNRGWTIFQDDPVLKAPEYHFYSSFRELLSSLKNVARHPI